MSCLLLSVIYIKSSDFCIKPTIFFRKFEGEKLSAKAPVEPAFNTFTYTFIVTSSNFGGKKMPNKEILKAYMFYS